MGPKGSIKPMRAASEVWECFVQFSVNATPVFTKVYGEGMSVTVNGVGDYTVEFSEVSPVLLDFKGTHWIQSGSDPLDFALVEGSFDKDAKTVDVEARDNAGAAADPANGDLVTFRATFLKTI